MAPTLATTGPKPSVATQQASGAQGSPPSAPLTSLGGDPETKHFIFNSTLPYRHGPLPHVNRAARTFTNHEGWLARDVTVLLYIILLRFAEVGLDVAREIDDNLYFKYNLLFTRYSKYVRTVQKSYIDSHFKYCLSLTKRPADHTSIFEGTSSAKLILFIFI